MYKFEFSFEDLKNGAVVELNDGRRMMSVKGHKSNVIWFVDKSLRLYTGRSIFRYITKVYRAKSGNVVDMIENPDVQLWGRENVKKQFTVNDLEKIMGCKIEIVADKRAVAGA